METQTISSSETAKTALQVSTTVLPGNRIEIVAPELKEGEAVDVILLIPERQARPKQPLMEFLESLPSGPRSYNTWEEFEQAFQEERSSWDR